ncbi:MAG TPA: hypothetical protein PKY82_20155 [Pyrinomonadaceae bacterium]|nr:hypothetical protein [Pyrinomonadaceae bacterium]
MSKLSKYMGYKEEDYKTPYAKYFIENMFPIQPHVLEGLEKSPFPAGRLPPVREAKLLANDEYAEIETGYSLENDGSMRIAILTKMPRVTPQMWDWWFGWHGCRDNRYKLWHPKAHKSAQWQDGKDDEAYIGRTSIIQEYIGKSLELASISFVSPLTLGFSPRNIENKDKNVFICARVGYTKLPIDFGWLLHQIRATEDGAEMRSRFWFGGEHIKVRLQGKIPQAVSVFLQKVVPLPEQRAKDLLLHCAEEMNHLAQFLPEIYQEFKA